jgi:hypothetical protein
MQWPWSYDFVAADNLESNINQASTKLINLMTCRGNWAKWYLTYPKNRDKQPGWVGTEYDTWAKQFDQSQAVLAGFVTGLAQLAFTLHNNSYSEAVKEGGAQWRTPMHSHAEVQSPGKAPPNSDPGKSGTQGATPDFLYKYSDQATGLNDQIRPFFTNTLPAVCDQTPASVLNGLNIASSKADVDLPGLVRGIAWSLRNQILELDARVRIVGEAFDLAGNKQTPGYFTFPTQKQLETTINNDLPSIQAANKLAQQVNQQGVTPDLFKKLQKYQNDPAFMATFFNGLSPTQIEDLLFTYGDPPPGAPPTQPDESGLLDQALVTAFASGALNQASAQQIVQNMPPSLLPALAKNPQAALNFVQSLTPEEISSMATYRPGRTTQSIQPEFIEVYAAAIKAAPDSNTAQHLFDQITKAVTTEPAGMTWNPGTVDGTAIGQLIAAMAAWELPKAPAGADQVGLQGWAQQVSGKYSGLLDQWLPWLKTTEAANQQSNADMQWIASTLVGMAVAQMPVDPGFDAAIWVVAGGIITTDLTNDLTSIMTNPTEDPQVIQMDLQKATTKMAQQLAIARLLQAGLIYTGKPGQEGSQPLQLSQPNLNAIMSAYASQTAHPSKSDDPQWSIRTPNGQDVTTFYFLGAIFNDSMNS